MFYIFILQKIVAQRGRHILFYIYCYFGQIFCTEVIQFFSVENMGHKELKKSSKYKVVDFLDEKRRFTFDIFLLLFIQGPPLFLTHSALAEEFAIVIRYCCYYFCSALMNFIEWGGVVLLIADCKLLLLKIRFHSYC